MIDPVAAPIVQRIYRMAMEGKGPYQIANILSNEHIEIPAYYHQKLGIGLWKTREIKSPYRWGSSTIVHILTNPSYLGHTCNFKTRKHFKDKKSHYVDQDQWNIIKDTHEPIIDQETYDTVQRMRAGIRRYPDGWGKFIPWPACCTVQTAAVRCTFTAPEMEIARQTFPVLVMAKSPLAVNAPVDTGSMLIRS